MSDLSLLTLLICPTWYLQLYFVVPICKSLSSLLLQCHVFQLQEQLGQLKDKLQWFAAKHQNILKTDPLFRKEFIEMCATIGVDPLASSKG